MLDEKATETTYQILGLLKVPNPNYHFILIQPLIVQLLIATYLQGRKDQIDKVSFEQLPDGSLKFFNK